MLLLVLRLLRLLRLLLILLPLLLFLLLRLRQLLRLLSNTHSLRRKLFSFVRRYVGVLKRPAKECVAPHIAAAVLPTPPPQTLGHPVSAGPCAQGVRGCTWSVSLTARAFLSPKVRGAVPGAGGRGVRQAAGGRAAPGRPKRTMGRNQRDEMHVD